MSKNSKFFENLKVVAGIGFGFFIYFNPLILAAASFVTLLLFCNTKHYQYQIVKVVVTVAGCAFLYFHNLVLVAAICVALSAAFYSYMEFAVARSNAESARARRA